jgi:hypothetical protein
VIPANRQRNYFQSALYVIIAGVAATVLLERLLTYMEAAEKAAVDVTLSQLHSGLYSRVAYLALRGEYETIDALPASSPFLTAQVLSSNYLGGFDGIPLDLKSGNWYYDRGHHELVYVPRLTRYLSSPAGEGAQPLLRYRVEVLKASKDAFIGVALKPAEVIRWEPFP